MMVEGPDSGYSWVIVFCCAYIHFALFGLFRSWGVIYVAVLQDYDVTREEASWPFSLCSAVFQLIGPAVSILTHYVSKRAACLLGCSIATIGIVSCYFAESVMWITIFYGVIHGLGFGVVVTLLPVFLNQYFLKHRATAMGIAFSGGSISSFIVPIAMEWLLENYNLRGSFLLLGGLVMNTLVASSLLKPPPWLKKPKTVSSNLIEDSEAKDSGVSADTPNEIKYHFSEANDCDPHEVFHDCECTSGQKDNENESNVVDMSQLDPSSLEEDSFEKQDTVVSNNDSMLFEGSVGKMYAITDSGENNKDEFCAKNYCEVQEPLMKDKHVYIVPKSEEPKDKNSKIKFTAYRSIMEILKNPMFHLIAFSMFVFFLSLQSFFVVIVDYAKDKGIPEAEGVYLMSIFSITDLIGRAGFGWVTDKNYIKRKNMVIFNLLVVSGLMQLYPIINNLTGLLTVAAFHGISAGSCITLFFVLQAEYLGIKRLTLVVGLTSFINGVLTLLRPAMIGMFRDTIGSYDWMFHFLGAICFIFSLIWLAESWVTRDKKSPTNCSNEKV